MKFSNFSVTLTRRDGSTIIIQKKKKTNLEVFRDPVDPIHKTE